MFGTIAKRAVSATLLAATMTLGGGLAVSADDDDLGAFLYKASCDNLSADAIVEDIGDLDIDDDSSKEWSLLSPDGAAQPDQMYVEDEDIDELTMDDVTSGEYSIAVHAQDSTDADVIACGEISGTPENDVLVVQLDEVDGSGFEGRVAIETHDQGIKVTTGVFSTGQVEPLGSPAASPSA